MVASPTEARLCVIGDLHGQYQKFIALLRLSSLVDGDLHWAGGATRLWIMGDLFDRGPQGVDVLRLLMDLQSQAQAAGGWVDSLLGNHDALLLAARRFGDLPSSGSGSTFYQDWLAMGGEPQDVERLTPAQADWLAARPALALEGETLLLHADATFYADYGGTREAANRSLRQALSGEAATLDRLLGLFNEHRAFLDGSQGKTRAEAILRQFGGRRLVHGHTPISKVTGGRRQMCGHPMRMRVGYASMSMAACTWVARDLSTAGSTARPRTLLG